MSTSDRYGLGLLLFSTAVCAQSTLVLERSTDRWGADFSATTAVSGEQCASICLANSACAAFTWQDNAGSGQPTMCWLKGVGTVPTTNSAFVSGAKGNVPRLSVVVANMNGVDNLPLYGVPSADWKTRLSRFAGIVAASGGPPDILALSEVTGWQWCWGEWRVFDYDVFDLVMSGLRDRTGVTYRVAHLTGNIKSYGGIGGTRCWTFVGNAVLYNPNRLVNRSLDDTGGVTQVPHDAAIFGSQLRRSLPICSRWTNMLPLESLIDGPLSNDKCTNKPSAPAWSVITQGVTTSGISYETASASLARFAFVHDSRFTFDLFNLHPMPGGEPTEDYALRSFIFGQQVSPRRTNSPILPPLVVGDLNAFVRTPWLTSWGYQEVDTADPAEVIAALHSVTPMPGIAYPRYSMTPSRSATLGPLPCGQPDWTTSFSDHCGLRVDYEPSGVIIH